MKPTRWARWIAATMFATAALAPAQVLAQVPARF